MALCNNNTNFINLNTTTTTTTTTTTNSNFNKRKFSSSNLSSSSDEDEGEFRSRKRSSVESSCGFSLSNLNSFAKLNESTTTNNNNSFNNQLSSSDIKARKNCFNYLVGAIDECWAKYCTFKTHSENEIFCYDSEYETDLTEYEEEQIDSKQEQQQQQHTKLPPTPQSLHSLQQPPQLENFNFSRSTRGSISSQDDESSCQLQELKDRLTRAKFFLQDLVDSDNYSDVLSFWKRWDMIKYATIELVEDDDDDEVVESTIEELETGRFYS